MTGCGAVRRIGCGLGMVMLAGAWTGCASLDDYRVLQRQNQNLQAEKQKLEDELFALRSNTDLLGARLDSQGQQLAGRENLVASLQSENDLLAEKVRMAEETLKQMAEKLSVGDIAISGPKLPEPLDTALKGFADAHPTSVTYDSRLGIVKWKGDLLFALGSDVVVDSAKDALRGFSEIINSPAAKDFDVIVVGHTDTTPIKHSATRAKHPTNWHLSVHRSIAVANVLMQNQYDPHRIAVMGYGQFRPVADNATPEGKSRNRRVEVYLVPQGSVATTSLGALLDTPLETLASRAR